MSSEISVRICHELEEFQGCVRLQQEIWGEDYLEIEPSAMFVVASHTGGQVLGAFAGNRMVGFTLAVAGVRNGSPYLHSHMTGVLNDFRDHGVGRMLKLFQREEALSRGIRLVEWTFDPLEMRNAHFNLNRLGAIMRRYIPNLYGITSSPLHRGIPTDRLVAEWYLDSPRVAAILNDPKSVEVSLSESIQLPVELEEWKKTDPDKVARVQTGLREKFNQYFNKGFAAVAIKSTPAGSAYIMAPWSDF